MFSKQWWKQVAERAVKTGAQALLTLLGTDASGLAHLDMVFVGRTTGFMMLLSVLTSIVTTKKGTDDPSAVS